MKKIKYLIVSLTIAIGLKACWVNSEKTKMPIATPESIAPARSNQPSPITPTTKPFSLTFKKLIENSQLNKLPVLTKNEIKQYAIETAIDENYADDYKYHLVEKVLDTPTHKLYLIAREYENENAVWLCLFDKNGQIKYAKEVYYDNAEGNYQVESTLKKDTLTLLIEDINEGKSVEIYTVDKNFNLIQQSQKAKKTSPN